MENRFDIAIAGAGPAGLAAAVTAMGLRKDLKVLVLEKMSQPAKKLAASGNGRGNLSNLQCPCRDEVLDFFKEAGIAVRADEAGRIYPYSEEAKSVAAVLCKRAEKLGAVIMTDSEVCNAEADPQGGFRIFVHSKKGKEEIFRAEKLLIATGGKSYAVYGSTGDGYRLAESVGHSITDIEPALISLIASNGFVPKLQGLSLRNISIKLLDGEKEIYSDFGEMMFTHYGVSGPVILSASSHMTHPKEHNYKIVIDLKPALDEQTLDKRIQRDFAENTNKDFINSLSKLLPNKLIPVIVKLSGIEPSEKVNQITKVQRQNLVSLLKNFTVNISDFRPINEAIITSGGVDVKEINPKTMGSKIVDNLYFAGEVIDVDAYTGGFNLQVAFSTGYLCGMNI